MELKVRGSSLEFRLHKLKYLDLLKEGRHKEALEYSKQFARFASDHTKGKSSLMFCDDDNFYEQITKKIMFLCVLGRLFYLLGEGKCCVLSHSQ